MLDKGIARNTWGRKIKRPEFSPGSPPPTPLLMQTVVFPPTSPQAAEKAGMSMAQAQGLLGKISTPQVKNQLKETTEAACKYGVSKFFCVSPIPVLRQSENLCCVPTLLSKGCSPSSPDNHHPLPSCPWSQGKERKETDGESRDRASES